MAPKKLLPFLFFAVVLSSLSGAEQNQDPVGITIRFFDRRVYYLAESPIYVQVTITNNGVDTWRFRMADERAFTVDFDARTVSNRAVEAAQVLVRKRSTWQQVFFREIVVESGESFSFTEDIRDYVHFTQAGSYVIQAWLYPGLYRAGNTAGGAAEPSTPLASNRLALNLRPPSIPGPGGVPLEMDGETGAVLVRERLPPDEVIAWTLTARQKSQWERFFLYLDVESLITRDGGRQRQWLAESEEGRQRMLARYRQDLQSAVIDGDIAVIPSDFRIERTTYGETEGTVVVLERFRGLSDTFVERKRYTYTLRRRDGVWIITDYVVLNLGTE
ncbi:MAG: hypothetical protein LBC88_04495 [Spirochaetaceae bacterium]|nr:hypothetical protein [Spirochaetaceae bacterium]